MPTELAIPFALSPDGSVAMVSDVYERVTQRVKAIVGTRPTERTMDANFGTPIDLLVFEPDDDEVEVEVQDMVSSILARYEPGVVVKSVVAEHNETGDGLASVEVLFDLSEDPRTGGSQFVNTAVIRPGGTVRETLRG